MLESIRSFVSSHNDVSEVVREAKRFSVTLPVVGRVGVPPPRHLAFYAVLGILGATELMPWPVVVGVGIGHALTVRASSGAQQPADTEQDGEPATRADMATTS